MKKKKSFVGNLIVVTAIAVLSMFTYLFTLNEIKALKKDKNLLEEKLSERINKYEEKLVEIQLLSSEDRISELAKTKLGLLHATQPFEKLVVDKNEIEQIKKVIESKYE